MSKPFEMWGDRIAAAETEAARRVLLAELAMFRARNLADVVKGRSATYTIARLHESLGERDAAVREARSLISLCMTPPGASDDEVDAARALMSGLGQSVPQVRRPPPERDRDRRGKKRERPERPARGARAERPERPEKPEGLGPARQAASAGDWAAARRALQGLKGAGSALVRAYIELSEALAAPEEQREQRLESVQAELRVAAGIRAPRQEPAVVELADDPLAALLGGPVPSRRAPRLRAIERWIEEHPNRVDEAAEAALKQHVASAGRTVPAPWLVGVVGQALAASESERTRAAIAELRAAGAVAVQAYDEWPFERLLRVMKRALAVGHSLAGLRRGVLAREEPDDRKIWTLRLGIDGAERMLAVAPHAAEPHAPGLAEQLAERLRALSPGTVLLATGSGNADLRRLAGEHGVAVLEHDDDDDALLAAATAAGPSAAARSPSPAEALKDALAAEPLDADAVRQAVAGFRRPDRAMRPVLGVPLDDERVASLLAAIHELSSPDAPIPEGTTLAIRAATSGPRTRALLEGPARERYGGPGIETVVDLAGALMADDWHVHRVLRGPTRREIRAQPALQTLEGALQGLWRLLVRRGDHKGEVWFVAELPIEGRAAVPLLLLEERERAVVLPVDADLLGWWGALQGAPTAIGWTGAEADALRQAAAAFRAVDGVRRQHTDEGALDRAEDYGGG